MKPLMYSTYSVYYLYVRAKHLEPDSVSCTNDRCLAEQFISSLPSTLIITVVL